MSLSAYLFCGAVAFIGALLHFFLKMGEKQKTARLANVEFFYKQYFQDEMISIIVSGLTILLALMLAGEAFGYKPEVMNLKNGIFAFIGYFGDSIASKVFGLAGKRLDAAIDYKTTELDKANNTLGSPTPATLPTDKPKQ